MQQVDNEVKEKYVLRVENNFKGTQFIKQLKKHLNKNTYSVKVRYSGKRPKGTSPYSTLKENATSMRVYIEGQAQPEQELRQKYTELLNAYRDLAKLV